ncbi:TniQ family protein [Aliarcobacter thereius]|uniref:TniQ family protein n=1 Tax=Aliarcobacter thereius TaxID=544718 RepID=A0A5R9H810_9BACT|nr:TniQ family protein [Aliarcobacter thereius]TLS73390.1 TniQ family protein [Aliarcobacter thereius]
MHKKRDNSWIQDYFFLIVPQPFEDELLSSWLTRVAIEHKRKLSIFLSLYVKKEGNSIARNDLDFLYDEKLFEALVNKSNLTKKDIFKMSLRSEEGYLYSCSDNNLYPPNQIRKLVDKRNHYGLMYCPQCLAEDKIPYFRKKWRYQFYNVCTKHEIFLTDRCWVCYERVNFSKIVHNKNLAICSKCEKDLRTSVCKNIEDYHKYGLEATKWFEEGLDNGYFTINNQNVPSIFIFDSFKRFVYLLDIKEGLILNEFPLVNEYKNLCKKLENYNSKKASMIYKDFFLTAMVYFLFQNFPNNLQKFAKDNDITYRDFFHSLKDTSFWYKDLIFVLVPMENKKGREIVESEVIGAIKYLESIGERINVINVAEIVGCHPSIHKGFNKIYKSLKF